ncbi:hypothetical protein ASF45_25025 [Pseudorhodoferax sp. Leaf265]|nr:hypothetical protein ASF45_25025 [Pseudorhodoferax sp. Leaf265]
MRSGLLRMHRYVGLLLAGFLVLTGLTGAMLAWNAELDEALNPGLLRAVPPALDAAMWSPLALRAAVQQRFPHALVARVPLAQEQGKAASFLLRRKPGSPPLADDQVFIDPYTGRILGTRRWGDLTQGVHNLMPFVYRLHYSLALGPVGTAVLGIAAVLWTLDCMVGLYLTLPARRRHAAAAGRSFWARWSPAWKLSMRSRFRMVFDVHRAGGLWLWVALLAMALSSVALNLPQVYDPVIQRLAARQPSTEALPARPPLGQPGLGWEQAHVRARALMGEEATRRGFVVRQESSLSYDFRRGLYRYDVRSSLDVKDKGGSTRIFLDADTGGLVGIWLPTAAAAGDTVTTWLTQLHMAAVGGRPMKAAIGLFGVAVAVLSCTGVVIWLRKRRAKRDAIRT